MKIEEVRGVANQICSYFFVEYKEIEEFHYKWMGECGDQGTIKIRLKVFRTNRPLHRHTIIRTLCHEIAHLVIFDHSKDFRMLERDIIKWAKGQNFWNF